MPPKKPKSFETTFERVEEILNILNENKLPLEASMELFEEANKLIIYCEGYLADSEQKICKLIKNRNGEIQLDANDSPKMENFSVNNDNMLKQEI